MDPAIERQHKQLFGHWACSTPSQALIKAGTQARMPMVWAETSSGKTAAHDIVFVLDEDMVAIDVLLKLESLARKKVKQDGAEELQPYSLRSIKQLGDEIIFLYEEW